MELPQRLLLYRADHKRSSEDTQYCSQWIQGLWDELSSYTSLLKTVTNTKDINIRSNSTHQSNVTIHNFDNQLQSDSTSSLNFHIKTHAKSNHIFENYVPNISRLQSTSTIEYLSVNSIGSKIRGYPFNQFLAPWEVQRFKVLTMFDPTKALKVESAQPCWNPPCIPRVASTKPANTPPRPDQTIIPQNTRFQLYRHTNSLHEVYNSSGPSGYLYHSFPLKRVSLFICLLAPTFRPIFGVRPYLGFLQPATTFQAIVC